MGTQVRWIVTSPFPCRAWTRTFHLRKWIHVGWSPFWCSDKGRLPHISGVGRDKVLICMISLLSFFFYRCRAESKKTPHLYSMCFHDSEKQLFSLVSVQPWSTVVQPHDKQTHINTSLPQFKWPRVSVCLCIHLCLSSDYTIMLSQKFALNLVQHNKFKKENQSPFRFYNMSIKQ